VNEGYLVMKCYRCGSTSLMMIKGVRNDLPLCPVCLEGELECKAIQPTIQMCREPVDASRDLNAYIATLTKFSIN
jgi:hypothetical protein